MLKEQIKQIVSNHIFGLSFTKRSDGSTRTGSFRLGVKRHLCDGDLPYDPDQHNLIGVFDMNKRQYRQIPLENINYIKCKGQTWRG